MGVVNDASLISIYKSFSTLFKETYANTPSDWEKVAMQTNSSGASTDYPWITGIPMMQEWKGDRKIKDLAAVSYNLKNLDFEASVKLLANAIKDDQVGVYTPVIQEMGYAAKIHRDLLVFGALASGFSTLCADGQNFFDTDHPVKVNDVETSVSNTGGGSGTPWYLLELARPMKPIILQIREEPSFTALDNPKDPNVWNRNEFLYGAQDRKVVGYGQWWMAFASKQALTPENVWAARAAMRAFKDDEGVPRGVKGTHLVGGGTHEKTISEICELDRFYDGTQYVDNPLKGKLQPLVVDWLD